MLVDLLRGGHRKDHRRALVHTSERVAKGHRQPADDGPSRQARLELLARPRPLVPKTRKPRLLPLPVILRLLRRQVTNFGAPSWTSPTGARPRRAPPVNAMAASWGRGQREVPTRRGAVDLSRRDPGHLLSSTRRRPADRRQSNSSSAAPADTMYPDTGSTRCAGGEDGQTFRPSPPLTGRSAGTTSRADLDRGKERRGR